MTYFSDQERGERPRDIEEIDEIAWAAIRSLIGTKIDDGSFGMNFPEKCTDRGAAVIGTDETRFWDVMRGEIRALGDIPPWYNHADQPATIDALDMIIFAWRTVAKPIPRGYHNYLSHEHLTFDRDAGREEFRADINRIFARNGLAYQLTGDGRIERLAPPILRDALRSTVFNSGDAMLDEMLDSARRKFLDHDPDMRRDALKELWDAWERLKTLGEGANKGKQADHLLDLAAGPSSPKFRAMLGDEAKALGHIGNGMHIRHSEVTQERLAHSFHVDYLFHRLFALIQLVLRTKD